jgi:hypothetical protein
LLTLLGDAARFLWLCLRPPAALAAENLVLLQKPVFDAFGENRVSIFQRVTAVKNRTF